MNAPSTRQAARVLALGLVSALLACGSAASGDDPGQVTDPGSPDAVADLPGDLPSVPDAPDATPPTDAPTDPASELPTSDLGMTDPGPFDFGGDVPEATCCISDAQCPAGWRCVPIPGSIGACKPPPGDGMCWMASDCGPDGICMGANPCACNQAEGGDGCDIPGHCVPHVPGCCNTDLDCPAGQDCTPGSTCHARLADGECWSPRDCAGIQTCVGATICPCGFVCLIGTSPGHCDPLPTECCYDDADCDEGAVCRARTPGDPAPGTCVVDPAGPACPEDAACCFNDDDCPDGWCEGAFACGCVGLCPTCGACPEPVLGRCRSWEVAVTFDEPGAGECVIPRGSPAFSSYALSLAWHTSLPAKTQLEIALNHYPVHPGAIPMTGDFALDHAFELSLSHLHFGDVPREGDRLLVRARATTASGGAGLSDPLEIAVDEAMAECMYPYDRRCSDGGPILCRALPPACTGERVMAAFAGCLRCVFPTTCTCDDGAPLECLAATPLCDGGRVAAVQNGCWVCANAYTCEPE
jgi:hypothetical protein